MELFRKDIPVVSPEFRIPRNDDTPVVYQGNQVRQIAVATFDPSANTSERTVAAHGLGVYIPDNAVIVKAWYDVVTTFTSPTSDAATIALHAQSAGDLVAADDIADATTPFDAGVRGTLAGFPALGADAAHDTALEVAALFAGTMIKMTAERELTATVAVEAVTAGKLNLFVEYVISD